MECNDKYCPNHGSISTRGRIFVGDVIKAAMTRTATVKWQRMFYIPKYERYEKRFTKIKAHVPACMKVGVNDKVKIMETRPISKTKNFVVVEVLKDESDQG